MTARHKLCLIEAIFPFVFPSHIILAIMNVVGKIILMSQVAMYRPTDNTHRLTSSPRLFPRVVSVVFSTETWFSKLQLEARVGRSDVVLLEGPGPVSVFIPSHAGRTSHRALPAPVPLGSPLLEPAPVRNLEQVSGLWGNRVILWSQEGHIKGISARA